MKRVALLMESWEKYFTYAWPSGIMDQFMKTGVKANLYVFNCNAGICGDEMIASGKRQIYKLPDFKDFDGIIIELNNTTDRKLLDRIIAEINVSGVPAVAINGEFEGLYSVCTDNYHSFMNILNHLYYSHASRDFWFITGPEDNYENRSRLKAVKDFIRDKGLARESYAIHEGGFDTDSGRASWRALRASYAKIPDVVVCTNDNVAVGVIAEAELENLRVPDNFLVTGFDNLDKARYFTPRITAAGVVRERLGAMAAQVLTDIWNGKAVSRSSMLEPVNIYWDSCGCMPARPDDLVSVRSDMREYTKKQILYSVEREEHSRRDAELRYHLQHCGTLEDILVEIEKWVAMWHCDSLDIAVQPMFRRIQKLSAAACEEIIPDNYSYERDGYPGVMDVCLSYDGARAKVNSGLEINGMFPYFDRSGTGNVFLFASISFLDIPIGYISIEGAGYIMEKQYVFDIVEAITDALGAMSMRSKKKVPEEADSSRAD